MSSVLNTITLLPPIGPAQTRRHAQPVRPAAPVIAATGCIVAQDTPATSAAFWHKIHPLVALCKQGCGAGSRDLPVPSRPFGRRPAGTNHQRNRLCKEGRTGDGGGCLPREGKKRREQRRRGSSSCGCGIKPLAALKRAQHPGRWGPRRLAWPCPPSPTPAHAAPRPPRPSATGGTLT